MVPAKTPLAVIGVGNTIAGDDGAGIEVILRLKKIWEGDPAVFLHALEGDHFEIAGLLDRAAKFIFVDAFEGEQPGELVCAAKARRAFAPSFHQTDIASVMACLETLGMADPFPSWEVWGVTIIPPSTIGDGLTPAVEAAVVALSEKLCGVIEEENRKFRTFTDGEQ